MRLILCVAATALFPWMVQASEPQSQKRSSIVTLSCEHCPPLKAKATVPTYQAPALAGAVQETIIRDIDGKKQIERSDQWLGGAPVRHISHAKTFLPPEAELMATPDTTIEKPNDGVDASATTSAVDGEAMPLRN